jgi:ATP-dependent Clp protease ATP-binding subunit ClpB
VIGRDEEIRRCIRILCRRTKNNPILIGEPGVGKTAIAEGLAQRIVKGDVPETLRDTQLHALDMGLLVAGTKYRGAAFLLLLSQPLQSLVGSILPCTLFLYA